MSKEPVKITIECSSHCGNPLLISESRYKSRKRWGQKNFYHPECLPKAKSIPRTPPKQTTGGIYPEYWKSR